MPEVAQNPGYFTHLRQQTKGRSEQAMFDSWLLAPAPVDTAKQN